VEGSDTLRVVTFKRESREGKRDRERRHPWEMPRDNPESLAEL